MDKTQFNFHRSNFIRHLCLVGTYAHFFPTCNKNITLKSKRLVRKMENNNMTDIMTIITIKMVQLRTYDL